MPRWMIKSAAELALMQKVNDVTYAANKIWDQSIAGRYDAGELSAVIAGSTAQI